MFLFHTRPFWLNTGVRRSVCVWDSIFAYWTSLSEVTQVCCCHIYNHMCTCGIISKILFLHYNYWDIIQNIVHNPLSSFPFTTKASSRTSKHWMGLLLWPGKHPVGCIHTMASQTHQRCEYTQWWNDQESKIYPKISADPQPPSRWSTHRIWVSLSCCIKLETNKLWTFGILLYIYRKSFYKTNFSSSTDF